MPEPISPAAPAADAGAAPVQPAAPTAPTEPTQPAVPPVNEPQLTPEEQVAKAEDDEWDSAFKQQFPGMRSTNKEPKKNEPAKPEKTPEEIAADEAAAKNKKPDAKQGASDGTETENPDDAAASDANAASRSARATARELAQQREVMVNDVRTKLFADVPEYLQDADGDPIRGIEDVMGLINEKTGETFTEEEAGLWLLNAQQQFNKAKADIEKQIESIAELNLDVKDQADAINAKYGKWLQAHTDIRDQIWADFAKTLKVDPNTKLVIEMPMPLETFYENALGPRVEAEVKTANDTAAAEKAKADADAKAKADAEAQRQKDRADRSDVYNPPANAGAPTDKDEEEWDSAYDSLYPNLRQGKK